MKSFRLVRRFAPVVSAVFLLAFHPFAQAATYFVSTNGNDAAAGTNWATAKQTIQAAVDAASSNDTVLVTNGVYQTGGYYNYAISYITNRVFIDKPLTVQSVNGPEVTIIRGFQDTVGQGLNSVRCLWVNAHIAATITGFTLTEGGTITFSDYSGGDNYSGGGGAHQNMASSPRATLNDCILSGNRAATGGAGVYGFIVNNCVLSSNAVFTTGNPQGGGGASQSILNNCTLTNNSSANRGGGADHSELNNCILANNSATEGGGAFQSKLNNCLIAGNAATNGYGGAVHGCKMNNCTAAGNSSSVAAAVNRSTNYNCVIVFNTAPAPASPKGQNWGAVGSWYENCYATGFDGNQPGSNNLLHAAYHDVFVDVTNGDYHPVATFIGINAGNDAYAPGSTDLDGQARIDGPGVDIGAYEINLATEAVLYVSTNGSDAANGFSWPQAKRTIQSAVDDAVPHTTVLVSNGVYDTGGRVLSGYLTNRVAISKPLTVRSVNGPTATTIRGFQDNASTNGRASVRCVAMAYTNNITLEGFTLADGGTLLSASFEGYDLRGGGVFRYQSVDNQQLFYLRPRVLNCILRNNHAREFGGGAYNVALHNCALWGNSADQGGGAAAVDLYNCTLWGNTSTNGGGVNGCALENCIVYFNTNTAGAVDNYADTMFTNSCTTPLPTGPGNFTNDPMLVDAANSNFQLAASSPCRDTGNNANAPVDPDLAGNPRIVHGYVDVGAYEYQGGTGQADYDGDGMGNGDEVLAGSSPVNSTSIWQIENFSLSNPTQFQIATVIGRLYAADFNDNLATSPQVWTEFTNNIPGTGSPITINLPAVTNRNFRIRVQIGP